MCLYRLSVPEVRVHSGAARLTPYAGTGDLFFGPVQLPEASFRPFQSRLCDIFALGPAGRLLRKTFVIPSAPWITQDLLAARGKAPTLTTSTTSGDTFPGLQIGGP